MTETFPEQIDLGDGLVLRWPEVDDAPALLAATTVDLDHLAPWLPWATAEGNTLAARAGFIEGCRAQAEAGPGRHLPPGRRATVGCRAAWGSTTASARAGWTSATGWPRRRRVGA